MVDVSCFVGLAGANAQRDIAVRPSGAQGTVPNDPRGGAPLVDPRQARHPTLMVLEATGGLERAVPGAWAPAGLPGGVVPPRQARDVARAPGQWAKTAAWDARVRGRMVPT
jgi:transposase